MRESERESIPEKNKQRVIGYIFARAARVKLDFEVNSFKSQCRK